MNSKISGKVELASVDYDPFASAALSRVVPTTEPQREVWLADRLGREASLAYNESIMLRFTGPLHVEALRGALQDLLARHEALRGTVSASGEELLIASEVTLDVPMMDHGALDAAGRAAAVAAARERVVEAPFDLEHGPLFRAEILTLGPADHALIITVHHIVCDGWSFGVLVNDLAALYAKRCGAVRELNASASFADYASARSAAFGGTEAAADEAFWVSHFAGPIPTLDLPTDRPRTAWRTFSSRRQDLTLDAELVVEMRKAGSRQGASLFAILLAGFAALLQRVAGGSDVVVGVPAAGQSVDGLGSLVGHCVNLLPLRLNVNASVRAKDLISATQSALLDAYEHQGLTFGSLLKKLPIPRDTGRLPLVSVMFNIDQELDSNAAGFPGLNVEFASNPRSFENFELFVNAVQVNGALRMECQYNADLFDADTIRRWLACFEMLMRSMCASVETRIERLTILPVADRDLLNKWNATAIPFGQNVLIHELFESQAKRVPDHVAVQFKGASLTYGDLDIRSNRIAHSLRQRGVRRGALVGLYLKRGPDMVAALLAVLKAGAAYVPLDPTYPPERLAFMAEDAGLGLLITDGSITNRFDWPNERTLWLDRDVAMLAGSPGTPLARDAESAVSTDRAYVIYTSGSTGKPKGVEVSHRGVINFLQTMAREPGLADTDRIVAVTTLSFDIAVNEILLPLSVGARIVLATAEESGDGAILAKLIVDSAANIMQATPATWRLLLEAGWDGDANFKALCGGEALTAELARRLIERTGYLWNMYGPTETTVWSTACCVDGVKNGIRIGRPIANTTAWVLDELRQLCPVGVPGELWIGGDGVALGYLNRPELTAERFIADPFSSAPDARLYRTGDRGRWCADGTLEHLGRLDFQVKVRGYRIELGEIEAALASYPGLNQAVAIAREDRPGDVRLVAYIVTQAWATTDEDALKKHLSATLPDYMVPQHVVSIASLPLLPNGKIDRRALPAPQAVSTSGREYVAPRDDLEKTVATEMEASLGMPGVGIHDDFFALGGHSLLAAQLTSRLNRNLNLQLTMRVVFAAPTIERLAGYIRSNVSGSSLVTRKPIERLKDRHQAPMSLMQERLWFLEELYPGRVTYHAPSAHRLIGPLNAPAFEKAFKEMVRRQPALRSCFEARGAGAVQIIRDEVVVSLFPVEDLSSLPRTERAPQLQRRLEELTNEIFDLSQAPLFKARMFRLAEDEHVLFFMPHHIIWDGWSFDLLYEEMSALYEAFIENRLSPLPELDISYGDFSAWHREWTRGPEFASQLEYWRGRLERMEVTEELPTDKPRRSGMSGAGKTAWVVVDAQRTDALHALSRQSGTTLFVTTLALYCVLLYDYSRLASLVIGTPVRGRNSLELESIMGFFTNLVPLQLPMIPDERFIDLVERTKAMVVESFAFPDVPLENLSRELALKHGSGRSILYQALFSFQDARQRIRQWADLTHQIIPLFQRGATEDLGMWFLESASGLQGGITYNTDIISDATAEALHRRYLVLLDMVIAAPSATLATLVDSNQPWKCPVVDETMETISSGSKTTGTSGDPEFAPKTETEKLLSSIWCAQLKLSTISTQDNFFDLGGHSLLTMQAILAMESKTGKRVERSRYIFESLGQIARAYDEAAMEAQPKQGRLRGLLSGILGGKKT